MSTVKYRILFSIEFLHDYYTTSRPGDFDVIPTASTRVLMSGLGMLWKMIGNQFIVLIPVDDNAAPFKTLSTNDSWKFYIQLTNAKFVNITNTTVQLSSRQRYYFNNLNQNESDSLFYLSREISNYNSSQDFLPGDFAADATGNVFEALKSSNNGNQHALNETAFWMNRGEKQFAAKDDLITMVTTIFPFEVSIAATHFTVEVFKLNIINGLFDIPVLQTEINTSTAVNSIVLNLEQLPPAKYRIKVNSDEKLVFCDNDAVYSGVFGIIEIFNHLAAANDFSLLDNLGVVKEKKFTLRFANRLAIWKYRTRTNDVTSIDDSSATYIFTQSVPLEFISNHPIPISETPVKTLSLMSTKLGKVNSLANPNGDRLNTILKDGDTLFCTEVFLNY